MSSFASMPVSVLLACRKQSFSILQPRFLAAFQHFLFRAQLLLKRQTQRKQSAHHHARSAEHRKVTTSFACCAVTATSPRLFETLQAHGYYAYFFCVCFGQEYHTALSIFFSHHHLPTPPPNGTIVQETFAVDLDKMPSFKSSDIPT